MPAYSPTSKQRLETCHPDLQLLFNEVIKEIDCTIACGHRGEDEQNAAFEAKTSTFRWPDSKHNRLPSMAVDSGPYAVEIKNIDWDDARAFCVLAGYVKCTAARLLREGKITHRIRWGGDWDGDGRTVDQKFHDLPHYELIPVGAKSG